MGLLIENRAKFRSGLFTIRTVSCCKKLTKPECKKLVVLCHNRKFNDMSPKNDQLSQQFHSQFLNGIHVAIIVIIIIP